MKPFETLEDISKSFNLLTIARQFNEQHNANLGYNYYGQLTVMLFLRSDRSQVEDTLGGMVNFMLPGMMPNPDTSQATEYDFNITPLPKLRVIEALKDVVPNVWVFTLIIEQVGNTDYYQVGISW